VWGALAAMPIYAAALNSTICPITFPFVFLFSFIPGIPAIGLAMFFPLAMYLTGKRFKAGMKQRLGLHVNKKMVIPCFTWNRLFLMTRVMAKYLYTAIIPNHCGMFDNFGAHMRDDIRVYNDFHSPNKKFWGCLALCLGVAAIGFYFHPVGTVWLFVLLAVHSQFNVTGQFYAQRYIYMCLPGLCAIIGTALAPYPVAVGCFATYLVIRTNFFIPAFKNMESFWRNDIDNFPRNSNVYNNLAQNYMANQKGGLTAWRANEIAYLLFRAEALEPTAWQTQMNIAAFFSMSGNIRTFIDRTKRAMALLEPLGGISQPMDNLREQLRRAEEDLARWMADPANKKWVDEHNAEEARKKKMQQEAMKQAAKPIPVAV
jgi:hypothetical protein